ncbi:hypothetical protein [Actinoplanes sp. HUAS TT8]|uniref:hypothetical protein n=1 Tax=Actinoplanes sp. HUAS TT8 TaxID=3447453 RepID=UPI003F52657E
MKGFVRVLAVAVSVALILVVGWKLGQGRTGTDAATCAAKVTEVRGIVGSEKEPFLRDSRVTEIFKCAGLRLRIDPTGSREMVDLLAGDSVKYDFAFPSSTPAAEKIKSVLNVKESYKPFSSVMGVATFKDTAEVLRRAGVVQTVGGQDVISVSKLIDLDRAGTSWKKLPGNESSANGNVVLMRTTDPADSNSAIMFLSIVSAVLNGDKPVASAASVTKVLPDMCRLMADQGLKPDTSGVLFEEYLTGGPTRTPIALVYESQFLDKVSTQRVPPDGQHVLLFPSPTVYAWHELVPLSDGGRKVGEMLRDDDTLKDLAAEYGFRPQGRTLADRPNPPVVVEPPAYKILETMLDRAAGCAE